MDGSTRTLPQPRIFNNSTAPSPLESSSSYIPPRFKPTSKTRSIHSQSSPNRNVPQIPTSTRIKLAGMSRSHSLGSISTSTSPSSSSASSSSSTPIYDLRSIRSSQEKEELPIQIPILPPTVPSKSRARPAPLNNINSANLQALSPRPPNKLIRRSSGAKEILPPIREAFKASEVTEVPFDKGLATFAEGRGRIQGTYEPSVFSVASNTEPLDSVQEETRAVLRSIPPYTGPARSVSNPTLSLPRISSGTSSQQPVNLPFPSRPQPRTPIAPIISKLPIQTQLPAHRPLSILSTRPPSQYIFDNPQPHRESVGSISSTFTSTNGSAYEGDVKFRGSRVFPEPTSRRQSAHGSSSSSLLEVENFSQEMEKHNGHEKRKRLALFLDETATMMEGGKSLAMVLPTGDPGASGTNLTLADLSEVSGGSPAALSVLKPGRFPPPIPLNSNSLSQHLSPTFSSKSDLEDTTKSPSRKQGLKFIHNSVPIRMERESSDSSISSGDSSISSGDSIGGPQFRKTSYVSPNASPGQEWENTKEEPILLEKNLNSLTANGLGIELEYQGFRPPIVDILPTSSSNTTPLVIDQKQFAMDELLLADTKRAEKRRRTIDELVETEASFASDMAVIRDIYFARARGAELSSIADYVMSSGLGLGNLLGTNPPARYSAHFNVSTPPVMQSRPSLRRSSTIALPTLIMGTPILSEKDIHVIFANLEEMALLSQQFSTILYEARGNGAEGEMGDQIGEAFLEMMPKIQQVYSTYCSRHDGAIQLLQELEPTLRTYFADCRELSNGRTKAWDLASLLIKPVQRCLKYPLLLQQILDATPKHHPGRSNLKRANSDILLVAQHINEVKKRQDLVGKILNKKDVRRGSVSSNGSASFGRSVTKKFLRSSTKVKQVVGILDVGPSDDEFDNLTSLVDSHRSSVLRFSTEMREFSDNTRLALEAQMRVVQGWKEVYARFEPESASELGYERLSVFLDSVIAPILAGPWRMMDEEIRGSLTLKAEHLLSLFENPRSVINKRNDKMLDHARYLGSKSALDRRGSEQFSLLSSQLSEELPAFLNSVGRYFKIIVAHFENCQSQYNLQVSQTWKEYSNEFGMMSMSPYEAIVKEEEWNKIDSLMDALSSGLGIVSIEEERESNLLYVAAAMATTKSTKFRLGHPILSMKEGDRINVFQEDADSPDSGGSGWVFGQLANGVRGFARTESLYIV